MSMPSVAGLKPVSLGIVLPMPGMGTWREEGRGIGPHRLKRKITELFRTDAGPDFRVCAVEDWLNLVAAFVPVEPAINGGPGAVNRMGHELNEAFLELGVCSVLEHPKVKKLCLKAWDGSPLEASLLNITRLESILDQIQGLGDLTKKEIALTGDPGVMERAVGNLINRVKSVNLLMPAGWEEPRGVALAFEETGIPIHLTDDPEVLSRTPLWLRFPGEDGQFDAMTAGYKGIIFDVEELKLLDTKNKKIFMLRPEFSLAMKRKIGLGMLRAFDPGILEKFIALACARALNISGFGAMEILGMRMSFKP